MDLPVKVFWSFTGFSLGREEKACSGMWVSGSFVGVGAEGGLLKTPVGAVPACLGLFLHMHTH